MATDYKTRLTADTSQHDNALKKSASQVYQYKKQTEQAKATLGNLAKKFGPLAAQIGIAGGALATLDKAFRSTEQGADALDRSLYAAKSGVNKFFQSLTSGNFDSFIGGLSDIVSTAKEAYNALDDLGTMKMWKGTKINELKAQIAMDRVVVNNASSSGSDRKAAQQRIDIAMKQIQVLTGDIIDQTIDAATKKLREIAGTSKVSDTQLLKYLEMWENGTLSEHYSRFQSSHTRQSAYTVVPTEGMPYTMYETKYDTENNRMLANAMKAIMTVNEDELKTYYALRDEVAALQTNVAGEQMKANRALNKGNDDGGSWSKLSYDSGSIADIEKQIQELHDRLKNEALKSNEAMVIQHQIDLLEEKKQAIEDSRKPLERMSDAIEQMPTLDDSIIDGDGIAAELQKAIDAIHETGLTIDDLTNLEAVGDSFGYIGDMFSSLSDVVGDESGKMFAAVGNSISAIGQAIAKISSLMMAEGAASVMDLPFPANLAALASVIAAVTGVIGSISSVASQQFAEGGIFQGRSTIGDYNLARVNAGEMILNGTQQSRLFKMLNNPTINASVPDLGGVTFTIHGSDLQGTLNNYNRKRGRAI